MNRIPMNRLAILLALSLLFINSDLHAQYDLLAEAERPAVIQQEKAEVILVDAGLKTSSYPSMEEEMAMYMELMKDMPVAFFFPNPTKGIIWLEHNLGTDCEVFIKDLGGNILYTAKNLQAKKIDMTRFSAGRYLLELKAGTKLVTKQLEVR